MKIPTLINHDLFMTEYYEGFFTNMKKHENAEVFFYYFGNTTHNMNYNNQLEGIQIFQNKNLLDLHSNIVVMYKNIAT